MYTDLNFAKYPMTKFNIDDHDFENLRSMHRISRESAQIYSEAENVTHLKRQISLTTTE